MSVIDLRVIFNITRKQGEGKTRVIVLSSEGMEFALYADSIGTVRTVAEFVVSSSLPSISSFPEGYLRGLIDNRVVLLDGGAILSDKNLIVYETVEYGRLLLPNLSDFNKATARDCPSNLMNAIGLSKLGDCISLHSLGDINAVLVAEKIGIAPQIPI